jgi:hypothetical protein
MQTQVDVLQGGKRMRLLESSIREMLQARVANQTLNVSFEKVWQSPQNTRWSRKKIALLVGAAVILFPSAVYAGSQVIWSNAKLVIDSHAQDYSTYITPLDEPFQEYWHEAKQESLSKSKLLANFPIRIPNEVQGWKHVHSTGLVGKSTIDKNGEIWTGDGPLSYVDEYQNATGQRVQVRQSYDASMTRALEDNRGDYDSTAGYPQGSTILHYGVDVGVLMPLQKGRLDLLVMHKETDGQVTDIDIWGYDGTTVEMFAQQYLNAPIQ